MRVACKNRVLWVLLPLFAVFALVLFPLASWADEAVDTAETPAAEELDEAAAVEEPVAAPDNPETPEPAATPETPAEPPEPEPAATTDEIAAVPAESSSEQPASAAQQPETPAPAAVVNAPRTATTKAKKAPADTTKDDAAKRPLANGTYLLRWSQDTTYLVQSADASRAAGADVQLGKDKGVNRQRWVVKYLAEYGFYSIINEYSKKALSVTSGKAGAKVLQDTAQAGAKKQLWSIVKVGRTYLIVPKANAKLAVTGEKSGSGYRLVLRGKKDAKNQCFFAKDQGIVSSGIYSLSLANDAKKAATLPAYDMKDKAKAWWYTYKKNMNQKLQVLYVGGGQYTLQMLHSGKYLGDDGKNVIQTSKGTAKTQRWRIVWNKTGIALKNVATGERLNVPNAIAKNKLLLSTEKWKNNAAQRFALSERRAINNGVYIIHTFAGNRALAVENGSLADLANIDAETTSKSTSQKFRIKYVKGKYRITNLRSGLVVGYESGKAGANVRQRPDVGSDSQLFKVVVTPKGGIRFVGAYGSKTLEIAGTDNKSGANVRMMRSTGAKEQRWWLERTKDTTADAITDRALRMAQVQGSDTNWYVAVDVKNHRTMVFKRSGGSWKLVKNWLCSVGAPSTPTVLGTYSVGIKGYSFGEGYTCYYYTQFWGDYLIHSVKYYQGTFNVKDGRLGQDISEGCVRLPIDQAKWIYDNIPEDTTVRTYR